VLTPPPKRDGRSRPNGGQGWNFHRHKPVQSLFGKAGNLTKKQFEKMIRK
jgi:hypothetical protein